MAGDGDDGDDGGEQGQLWPTTIETRQNTIHVSAVSDASHHAHPASVTGTRGNIPLGCLTVFLNHVLLIWNKAVAAMVLEAATQPEFFTATSAYSLAAVAMIGFTASTAANAFLPENARWQDRATFVWLAFDAMIHFSFEGSFLYLSTFGRQVSTSDGPFAELWKEYARADFRWGFSDPTVVSLEILTVLGAGPLCCYILYQLVKKDPARHYWIVVLSTAEIYGGWMTFCPEWLTGSPNLETSNPLYLYVYLFFMNIIWVIIPVWLMVDSYGHIAKSIRQAQAVEEATKSD